jgi:hypothetical protein
MYTIGRARINAKALREIQEKLIGLWYRETFEGPARLELFGHVTHIGWVRQGPDRIDVLTIGGEALQCDARARYRLTPLTWKDFVAECLRRKEEGESRLEHEVRILKTARAEAEERRIDLRNAIAEALEQYAAPAEGAEASAEQANRVICILDAAREKDDKYDEIPF